jgi:Zn-dependent M28 family amino/carboxypeptidase
VNATEYPNEFQSLTDTNSKGKYFVDIGARGKAANSDHYWFTENGVPAFFIYTRGGIRAYHDVFDKAETLPLDHVDALRELIIQFYSQMMGP